VPVHVQSVVEERSRSSAASLTTDVRLENGSMRRYGGGGRRDQLHQVAMNLCTNALQAMEHGGVLTVALEKDGGGPSAGCSRTARCCRVRMCACR